MAEPTTRELVERMTRDKFTPREIAERLRISTQAVYYHLRRIDEGRTR